MANIHDVYNDIGKMTTLAEKVGEDNYSPATDLFEQAERLSEVAEIAKRNAELLYALDGALSE